MKAKRKPRIQLDNRPRLQEHIPLLAPFVINVDPSDRCNLRCRFCPTGDHDLMKQTPGRNFGPMKMDLFRQVVDDICGFPQQIKVLRLYKEGEPLSNPHFAEMVAHAKQRSCSAVVDTTTNAVLLSEEKARAIVAAGLDRMNISIYGVNSSQYERFTGRPVDMEALIANVNRFYELSRGKCIVNVKVNSDVISEEDLNRFYDIFGDICDEISDEHVMSCWPGFDLAEKGIRPNPLIGIYGQEIREVAVCPYVFYSFSVNSDGSVSACFLDWQRKLVIGDTRCESLVDIWRGGLLRAHQEMMLRGERRSHPICGNCDQFRRGMPDNIDAFRDDLLAKLRQTA